MLRTIFLDKLKVKVTNTKTVNEINSLISKYVDRNAEILLSLDLSSRYSFGDEDRNKLYDIVDISPMDLLDAVKNSKHIAKNNKIQSNPFYILCILIVGAINNTSKPDSKLAINVLTYMSLMMYTSIHRGFYKYPPNKQIMDYTVANLDSSFSIRNSSSVFAFILENATTLYNTYTNDNKLVECNDKDITWVIDANWTRLKLKFRKISNAFYDNHKNGRYLNTDSEVVDDTGFREITNDSYAISNLTGKVVMKLINGQYNQTFIKYSITSSDVSNIKLRNLIEDISSDDTPTLQKFISSIIEYFLISSTKSISYVSKGDFISYMKKIYASNTSTPQVVYIKDTLKLWIEENLIASGKSRYGTTTAAAYKKALYMFFIFVINSEAKTS